MTQISKLTAIDPRSQWAKISRRQYWIGLKAHNIPCHSGAKQSEMIKICQASGLTPEQIVNFVPVTVNTPDGEGKLVMVPEEHERKYDEQKEHRRMELFEQRIEAAVKAEEARVQAEKDELEASKNAEITELKSELDELKGMMKQLLEGDSQKTPKPEKGLQDMHWKSFQKAAKEVGIDWTTKDPREPVIAQIEAQHGENAA